MMEDLKRVYAVSRGEYSDYRVIAAFSNREKAQAFIDKYYNNLRGHAYDYPDIEELLIDPPDNIKADGWKRFEVTMKKDGEVVDVEELKNCSIEDLVEKTEACHPLHRRYESVKVQCTCKDEQTAIKIANEIRGQRIALDLWPQRPRERCERSHDFNPCLLTSHKANTYPALLCQHCGFIEIDTETLIKLNQDFRSKWGMLAGPYDQIFTKVEQ